MGWSVRAPLLVVGLLAVMCPCMLVWYCTVWSTLVNPALPAVDRCGHILEVVFVRHAFVTVPCVLVMTGGMHLLVTAVLKRHRLLFNFCCAVFLTWLLLSAVIGPFLLGQLSH